jgi:hypothetical protein
VAFTKILTIYQIILLKYAKDCGLSRNNTENVAIIFGEENKFCSSYFKINKIKILFKHAKDLSDYFSKDMQIANMYMKRCSTPVTIREMHRESLPLPQENGCYQ